MATIITPASNAVASGVSKPRTSNNPQTNSTVETKTALNSGKTTCALINVWHISFRRSGTKSLARPDKKNSKPTATRATRMATHSNECSSLAKIRAHDIDQKVKFNSRAVNEIGGENLLATEGLCRDELLWEKHYVKTITRSFAGSGVHLRDSERARTATRSSTNADSAG
jgi:hypothetical protein